MRDLSQTRALHHLLPQEPLLWVLRHVGASRLRLHGPPSLLSRKSPLPGPNQPLLLHVPTPLCTGRPLGRLRWTVRCLRRHRLGSTGPLSLKCEAGELHLKKGVMLRLCVSDYYFLPLSPFPCLVDCAPSPPYLLHALPSPLRYYIRVHQYLLMCTLCALFMTASPHRYLMYHCTFCARFPAL